MTRRLGDALVWLALGAAAFLAFNALSGCSSPLRAHAVGVTLAHAALTSGSDAVMDARAADLDACPDPACLDAGEARWQPWVASLRLVVEAWETWRDAVVTGFGLPDEAVAAAIAAVALRHLLALWAALADVVPGGVLPRSPAEVLALIGGGS